MPTRKVGAGALAGALATILVGVLGMNGVELPDGMEGAIVVFFTFITQYFVSDNPSS